MRTLLAALALLLAAPAVAGANPCHARCRERARACKDQCKLSHGEGASPARHQCMERCDLHEHQCRAGC
jgi:hypothetical protein